MAHVTSSLHLLLQSTTPQSDISASGAGGAGGAAAAAAAAAEGAGVGIYGYAEFAVLAADLRQLLLSTATLSGSWARMLDNLFALKSRADARLQAAKLN